MIAVINDVSFQYTFATKELAMEYMHKFLDICKRIKREEVTNVHEIKTGVIDTPVIKARVAGEEVSLRNLSKEEHINHYRKELGLRRYIANDTKHKSDRENPYGKGKIGSRMDLDDEEAQELLNRALLIKGRLYAKKNGCYYAFQNERDIDYHGYRADDVGEDIKSQLDKEFARE